MVLWQILGQSVNPIFFSPPLRVAARFQQLWIDGTLPSETYVTLYTVIIGFLISALVGIPLGLVLGRSKSSEYALDPYVNLIYATPIVAIIPLVAIWFGSSILSSYLIVFLTTMFPILINTLAGVKDVNKSLLETGRSFGFGGISLWRKVVLPGSVPYIMGGLRVGMGAAVIGALLAEIFLFYAGLGYTIVFGLSEFDTSGIISAVLLTMALGIGLTEGVKYIERRTSSWSRGAVGLV
ncbi:MAG: ABC transporter permease [Nitrososphaerales archaeon]